MATVTSCMKVMAWLFSLSHELFCMGLGTSTLLLCGGKTFRTARQEANGAGLAGAQNLTGHLVWFLELWFWSGFPALPTPHTALVAVDQHTDFCDRQRTCVQLLCRELALEPNGPVT